MANQTLLVNTSELLVNQPTKITLKASAASQAELAIYTNTRTDGIYAYIPIAWAPYVELTRMTNVFLHCAFLFPFSAGIIFAALSLPSLPPASLLLKYLGYAYLATVGMGLAGHAIDDWSDYDLDAKVPRCANRPIPRGAISPRAGFIFAVTTNILYIAVMHALFGTEALPYTIAKSILMWVYPLSKRFTYYPQFILGITFSVPIPLIASALGVDPLREYIAALTTGIPLAPAAVGRFNAMAAVFAAFTLWTVIFDTAYGILDVKDDIKAGIYSTAVRFKECMMEFLYTLAVAHVALLVTVGRSLGCGAVYFAGCAITAGHLAYLLSGLDVKQPKSIAKFFFSVMFYVGGEMVFSMLGELVYRKFVA